MIGAVFFDLDDTLVESGSCHYESGLRAFSDFGLDYEEAARRTGVFSGMKTQDAFVLRRDALGKSESDAPIKELLARKEQYFLELFPQRAKLLLGASQAVESAAAAGLICGVVSSSNSAIVASLLDHFHLMSRIKFLVTGDDVERGKPDPECYDLAFRQLQSYKPTARTECLVIEDSAIGLKAAQEAGLPVCFVPVGPNSPALNADHVLESLEGFPALIRWLSGANRR